MIKSYYLPGLFSLIFILSQTSCQPYLAESDSETAETIPDTIPFVLTEANNVVIQAILNERDTLNLMFHTAANDLSIIREATQNLRGVTFSQPDTVKSWGGESTARYSENNALRIANLEWNNITFWENEYSGPTTDGKFGINLFGDKIIELDFDRSYMLIHHSLPQLDDTYEKEELLQENGFMFVEGDCLIGDSSFSQWFLIHSGFGKSLLLDDDFVRSHQIGEKLATISESVLRDSYGNELICREAILPAFVLGETRFLDLPIGFFEGAIGRQKMSVLGGELLKRFNLILDLKDSSIYLQPNHYMNS